MTCCFIGMQVLFMQYPLGVFHKSSHWFGFGYVGRFLYRFLLGQNQPRPLAQLVTCSTTAVQTHPADVSLEGSGEEGTGVRQGPKEGPLHPWIINSRTC